MKDAMADTIGKYILYAKLQRLRPPIGIRTYQYSKRKRDFDSGTFATKVFADTLVAMGRLTDDNGDFVIYNMAFASIKAKDEKTIFIIDELSNEQIESFRGCLLEGLSSDLPDRGF